MSEGIQWKGYKVKINLHWYSNPLDLFKTISGSSHILTHSVKTIEAIPASIAFVSFFSAAASVQAFVILRVHS